MSEHETAIPEALAPVPAAEDNTIDLQEWVQKQEVKQQRTAQAAPMVTVDERRYAMLTRAQILLAAMVRPHGRVRISRSDVDAITKKTGLDVRVQDNGDMVVTLLER
jgi:hypothetical protein